MPPIDHLIAFLGYAHIDGAILACFGIVEKDRRANHHFLDVYEAGARYGEDRD